MCVCVSVCVCVCVCVGGCYFTQLTILQHDDDQYTLVVVRTQISLSLRQNSKSMRGCLCQIMCVRHDVVHSQSQSCTPNLFKLARIKNGPLPFYKLKTMIMNMIKTLI